MLNIIWLPFYSKYCNNMEQCILNMANMSPNFYLNINPYNEFDIYSSIVFSHSFYIYMS